MGMKKILIIDYDHNSLTSLKALFTEHGYEVVTAADGQSGWDKYNKECPDLVLMEAMLPKVHGFELCQRITSERHSQATVFIMTGVYKDRIYRTEALRTYGASEYFEKPLNIGELLASVEALLGKPEPRRVEPKAMAEAPTPAAVLAAEPRKREKPKFDDSLFALPEDLDRLSRATPKIRKPVQAPSRRETEAKAKPESLADDLLKSVINETTAPRTVEPDPSGGNGNGGGPADIDQFLRSALADLDLKKDKIKVPKAAPAPPQPVKPKPAAPEKAQPAAPEKAEYKARPEPPPMPKPEPPPMPKPAPPPAPRPADLVSAPVKDMKNTLTPGDPGSDVSPFFTPVKPKPEPPFERSRFRAAPASPAPKPFIPDSEQERRAAPETANAGQDPVRPDPSRSDAAKSYPRPEIKHPDTLPTASGDIFRDVVEVEERKGFPTVAALAIGIVAVAAVGFFLLRPKHADPVKGIQTPPAAAVQEAMPPAPLVEQATESDTGRGTEPESKPEPAPVKPKPKSKTAVAAPTGAEAILPQGGPVAPELPALKASIGGGTDQGQARGSSEPPASKTEAPPPAAEAQANAAGDPTAGGEAGSGVVRDIPPAAPLTVSRPDEPPVNEGDLVELSSVTEPPEIVKSVDPVYPPSAQRLGVGGSITVNALIDEKGEVIETGILKGIQDDMGLHRAAQNAVRKWKFVPARKNGVAVKVWKAFVIVFKAEVNPANMSR